MAQKPSKRVLQKQKKSPAVQEIFLYPLLLELRWYGSFARIHLFAQFLHALVVHVFIKGH